MLHPPLISLRQGRAMHLCIGEYTICIEEKVTSIAALRGYHCHIPSYTNFLEMYKALCTSNIRGVVKNAA